ncbi:hypothetical protein [Streptomyces sp. LN704]|uniref:hypothetical protein n=1 Tax=Streptomyces sp. LN704 TaxID=3112982 RepID=UPI003713AAC2
MTGPKTKQLPVLACTDVEHLKENPVKALAARSYGPVEDLTLATYRSPLPDRAKSWSAPRLRR